MYVCLFVCLSVCVVVPKDLAELIGFFLTGQLLIGPGKVYNYFLGGGDTPNHQKNENNVLKPSQDMCQAFLK